MRQFKVGDRVQDNGRRGYSFSPFNPTGVVTDVNFLGDNYYCVKLDIDSISDRYQQGLACSSDGDWYYESGEIELIQEEPMRESETIGTRRGYSIGQEVIYSFENDESEYRDGGDSHWSSYDGEIATINQIDIFDDYFPYRLEFNSGDTHWVHGDATRPTESVRWLSQGESRVVHQSIDPVNQPAHYTQHPSGVECIEIAEHMDFNLGNALKYIWRADLKGDAIEDLEKAQWYIRRELKKRGSKNG